MTPIKMMVNGLPGNVAAVVAEMAIEDSGFEVIAASLTGPEITASEVVIGDRTCRLIRPEKRDEAIQALVADQGPFISVDYTHPSAVNSNAEFYCRHELPFVMGTTGGDRQKLHQTVQASNILAVIAPNMAKQIVGIQAMLAHGAEHFPGLFSGYRLEVTESHQAGKADTSGTAKAMVTYFNRMGIPFSADDIEMVRDPVAQKERLGVPEAHLGGHGWHTYRVTSGDDTVSLGFTHNVNGRRIYAAGTLDAVRFLSAKVENVAKRGIVYDMIDVLRGG